MTKAYSDDLRERVVAAMQSAESCRRVAARFGVVPSSVVKWTDQARRTGSVSPAKMGGIAARSSSCTGAGCRVKCATAPM
ncbi:MAG: transposase [Pseudomonadota bacterium]